MARFRFEQVETTLAVTTEYADFSEFWENLLTGTGSAAAFAVPAPTS